MWKGVSPELQHKMLTELVNTRNLLHDYVRHHMDKPLTLDNLDKVFRNLNAVMRLQACIEAVEKGQL